MDCEIVKDLLPLYIDGCCSPESRTAVEEHMKTCAVCRSFFAQMRAPSGIATVAEPPKTFRRLRDWQASVMQSVLLFLSFGLVTVGVALEAGTPAGDGNGAWALGLIVPATGFLLSLANWYFVRVYRSRTCFSACSMLATAAVTLGAYVWALCHYEMAVSDLFAGAHGRLGLMLTVLFCGLSKILSDRYARMLGKE